MLRGYLYAEKKWKSVKSKIGNHWLFGLKNHEAEVYMYCFESKNLNKNYRKSYFMKQRKFYFALYYQINVIRFMEFDKSDSATDRIRFFKRRTGSSFSINLNRFEPIK